MRWFRPVILALIALFPAVNCATVFSDSKYEYSFQSEPEAATVTIFSQGNEISRLQTPGAYELDLDSDYYFRFELDGYETHTIRLQKDVDLWIIGNIVFFSYIGLVIDALTGAIHKPDTTTIRWSFKQKTSTAGEGPGSDSITLAIEYSSPRTGTTVARFDIHKGTGERYYNLHEQSAVPL